jgi:hypothetical protein
MTDPVAAVLSFLTTILFVSVWNVVTGMLPGSVGLGVQVIALLVSFIAGFVVYHNFSRNR